MKTTKRLMAFGAAPPPGSDWSGKDRVFSCFLSNAKLCKRNFKQSHEEVPMCILISFWWIRVVRKFIQWDIQFIATNLLIVSQSNSAKWCWACNKMKITTSRMFSKRNPKNQFNYIKCYWYNIQILKDGNKFKILIM